MPGSKIALLIAAALAFAGGAYYLGQTRREPEPTPPAPPASAPATAVAPPPSAEPVPPEAPAEPAAAAGSAQPLPADAPRKVGVGVVLISYRGAEGAPASARPKSEALEKARVITAEAKRDFAEAVKLGDRGSTADAGSIPRGVLEPQLEFAVFTLKEGEVSAAPLDTPRGYWVVRRNH